MSPALNCCSGPYEARHCLKNSNFPNLTLFLTSFSFYLRFSLCFCTGIRYISYAIQWPSGRKHGRPNQFNDIPSHFRMKSSRQRLLAYLLSCAIFNFPLVLWINANNHNKETYKLYLLRHLLWQTKIWFGIAYHELIFN